MKTSFSINVDFDEIDIDDFIEYLEDWKSHTNLTGWVKLVWLFQGQRL